MTEAFRFDNYSKSRAVPLRDRLVPRSSTPAGAVWYEWRVFMSEPPERLELVDQVEYRLHYTFPDPIRVVTDRKSRFALDASGWGEFVIYITIYTKDGHEQFAEYALDLSKPPPPS